MPEYAPDRAPTESTVTRPIEGQVPVYPQAEAHTWNAFAFLAIELGGYGDFEVVNPYNGVRLNAPVIDNGKSMYDNLRSLVDELEKADFLNIKAIEAKEPRPLTREDFGDTLLAQQMPVEGVPDWFAGACSSVLTKRVGSVVTPEEALAAWQRFRTV